MTDHRFEHVRYWDIDNATSSAAHLDMRVLVEEKIDGSNFYFVTDGVAVACGRRNAILEDDEKFFDYRSAADELKPKMLQLYALLGLKKGFTLYLYGELIPTQTRIQYLRDGDPRKHFIAFDAVMYFAASWGAALLKSEWEAQARECGFLVVPTLAECTLAEALAIDVETMRSAIPRLVDPSSFVDSPVEGIVIKDELGFVWKKKAAAFAERGGRVRIARGIDQKRAALAEIIEPLVCVNRLENVLSHIGRDLVEDAPRLALAVVNDAIDEARREGAFEGRAFSNSLLSKVKKEIAKEFESEVKGHMQWA